MIRPRRKNKFVFKKRGAPKRKELFRHRAPDRLKTKDKLFKIRGRIKKVLPVFDFSFKRWYFQNVQAKLETKFFRIFIASVLLILMIFCLVTAALDQKKSYQYVEERNLNFSNLNWEKKVGDEGYTYFPSEKDSFEWKVDIYTPKSSFIFIVNDVAKIVLSVRNIKGTIKVTSSATFKGMENYPVENGFRTVSDRKELVLYGNTHFASILGLNFVSAPNGRTFKINNDFLTFNSVAVHLPNESKILKKGDGTYPGGMYELSEKDVFFHNFTLPCIVYINPSYHKIIQTIITLIIIILFVFSISYIRLIKKINLPIQKKHLYYGIICCLALILIFSVIIPNPRNVILRWDNRPDLNYDTEAMIATDVEIPDYLWWVLGITKSIDAYIVGETTNCLPNVYQHLHLTKLGVKKVYILSQFQDSYCANIIKGITPKSKIEVVSEEKLKSVLKENFKDNNYPWWWLFKINAKIVTLLSNLLVTFFMALLFWKATEIKNIKDAIKIITFGFLSFFILIFIYILCGIFIQMPLAYHAKNTLGLIVNNYFLPGSIGGGNNLRTLFSLIGLFCILFFIKKLREQINLLLIPIVICFILVFFVIPKTEYFAKRILLTITSAEAYQWDYKQDSLNPFDFYRASRDNELYPYLQTALSKKEKGERELIFAESLLSENRFQEAVEVYKNIIKNYQEFSEIRYIANYGLGESYFKLRETNIILPEFWKTTVTSAKLYYSEKTIESYSNFLNEATHDPDSIVIENLKNGRLRLYTTRALFHRGICYLENRDNVKAVWSFEENSKRFPEGEYTIESIFYMGEAFMHMGKLKEAATLYAEFISKYHDLEIVAYAKLRLADCYLREREYQIAYTRYLDLFAQYPEKDFTPVARFEAAYAFENLVTDRSLIIENYKKLLVDFPENIEVASLTINRLKELTTHYNEQTYNQFLEGINLTKNGDYSMADAENHFKSILLSSPERSLKINTHFRLIDVYKHFNKTDLVDKEYNFILENFSEAPIEFYVRRQKAFQNDDYQLISFYNNKINEYLKKFGRSDDQLNQLKIYDTDKDGLFDLEEIIIYKTDRLNGDTDGDNISDYEEVAKNSNPLDSNNKPKTIEEIKRETIAKLPQLKKENETFLGNLWSQYLKQVALSRGMTLFFAGVICLTIVVVLQKNLRTFSIIFIFIILSRGITRIGEQDPFRAVKSVYPGIISGTKIVALLLFLTIAVFLIKNIRKIWSKVHDFRSNRKQFKQEFYQAIAKNWKKIIS